MSVSVEGEKSRFSYNTYTQHDSSTFMLSWRGNRDDSDEDVEREKESETKRHNALFD